MNLNQALQRFLMENYGANKEQAAEAATGMEYYITSEYMPEVLSLYNIDSSAEPVELPPVTPDMEWVEVLVRQTIADREWDATESQIAEWVSDLSMGDSDSLDKAELEVLVYVAGELGKDV